MSFWLLSPFCFVISFNSSFVVWVSGSAGVWQGQLLWNLDRGWMQENLLPTCCLRHSLRFFVFEEVFLSTEHLTCFQYLLDMYWIHVNLFNYELKWSITAHFVGRQRFFVGVKKCFYCRRVPSFFYNLVQHLFEEDRRVCFHLITYELNTYESFAK